MIKGLILAGGMGTRLLPITKQINKHCVPLLNKPMILYPLETLKSLKIKDIMIVSGGGHIGGIAEFLGDGSDYGVNLTYRVQKEAGGIGQALGLAKDFVGKNHIAVILGDNIFDNEEIKKFKLVENENAVLFFSRQEDNSRFGVPSFNKKMEIVSIEEKPKKPKSAFAVTGLYIYPPNVFNIIPRIKPSKRGEIEITTVNNWYIYKRKCAWGILEKFWSDAGTRDSLKECIDWVYEKEKDPLTKEIQKNIL